MRRSLVVPVMLAVLALGLAACDNNKEAPPAGTETTATGALDSPSPEPIAQGTYLYNNYGVRATLKPDGENWALEVTNNTSAPLGNVNIYALDAATGRQINATVEDATGLDPKKSGEYTVTGLPTESRNVGLMILEFGEENWGAFSPG